MKVKLKAKGFKKKKSKFFSYRKRVCRFCADRLKRIDFKDLKIMESFIKERGRMVSSRSSGTCAKHQRQLSQAIKHARFLALLPYTTYK
ncbi:MAG: 30S ribosomal protein S18 [Candidatus Omnitrophota bacterium]|nr:30S ribosomal protein S18 [Candidatus Omnitrophota bacterium]